MIKKPTGGGKALPSDDVFQDNDDRDRRDLLMSFTFPSGVDPLKSTSSDGTIDQCFDKDDLDSLVKTVNNFSRMHEALAFLNDDTRSITEKQIAVMTQNSHGMTSLFWAVRRNPDVELIEKMVEIGGQELLLLQNKSFENVVHQAAFLGSPFEIFKIIVNAGGKEVLLQKDSKGNTPLHYACAWGVDERVIHLMADIGGKEVLMIENEKKMLAYTDIHKSQSYLAEIGGLEYENKVVEQENFDMSFFDFIMLNKTEKAELILDDKQRREEVFDTNDNGLNPLMVAIWFLGNTSAMFQNRLTSLIRKMVRSGGKKLVEMKNNTRSNAIHYAAFNNAPIEIIQLLVQVGGQDLLRVQNNWLNTPCHDACIRPAPVRVIEFLVRKGGNSALTTRNKEKKTPLDMLYDADIPSDEHILAFQRAWYELDPHFSSVCSRQILFKTLQWCNRVDTTYVTSNNFVKSILNERFIWPRYQAVMFADFYSQAAVVLFLSPLWLNSLYEDYNFVGTNENNQIEVLSTVLIICTLWFMGRELIQLYASPIKSYAQDPGNYFDILQVVVLLLTLREIPGIINGETSESKIRRSTFIFASFFSWAQLLRVVSKLFYSISVFVYATGQIILQLASFILTALIIVAAFAQIFFIAGSGTKICNDFMENGILVDENEPWQCKARSSYLQTFGMVLTTDFEFLEWSTKEEDPDILYLRLISFTFGLLVGILLLNILIAVVNNVFTKVSEESENAFWTTRMDFMFEVNMIVNSIFQLFNGGNDGDEKERAHEVDKITVRKAFGEYDDEWMIHVCTEEDLEQFYKWWYYSWKKERPALKTRLWYYYRYASFTEIVYPSKVYQNILFGVKYDQDIKGVKFGFAMLMSLLHFMLAIVAVITIFLLGLLSFGILWPTEMNKMMFFGPIDSKTAEVTRDEKASPSVVEKSKIDMLEQQMVYLKQQNADMKIQMARMLRLLSLKSR